MSITKWYKPNKIKIWKKYFCSLFLLYNIQSWRNNFNISSSIFKEDGYQDNTSQWMQKLQKEQRTFAYKTNTLQGNDRETGI